MYNLRELNMVDVQQGAVRFNASVKLKHEKDP